LSYLHRDQLGSVTMLADSMGAEAVETAYYPFGLQAFRQTTDPGLAGEAKGFIGERLDVDAGLQYLNARYYDPELGLFLQPDWFEVTKAGVGTNRYAYSGNDPVNMRDPTGNAAERRNGWKRFKDWVRRGFEIGAERRRLSRDYGGARVTYDRRHGYRVWDGGRSFAPYEATVSTNDREFGWAMVFDPIHAEMNAGGGAMPSAISARVQRLMATGGIRTFRSFRALKRTMGTNGPEWPWHHIVEQGGKNAQRFAPQMLHNTRNVVQIPRSTHYRITGHYNRVIDPRSGTRVRDVVQSWSYRDQYRYGSQVLDEALQGLDQFSLPVGFLR